MRTLSIQDMKTVPGGSEDKNQLDSGKPGGNSQYNEPGVVNCNNGVIGGMIAGLLGGLAGVTLGVAGGAISGGCFNKGNNSNPEPSSPNGRNNNSAGSSGK